MTASTHLPAPSNRKPFYWVLSLFFAPLVIAFAVYYGSAWRPSGTTNKGDLITPAIPLPKVALTTADGKTTTAGFLHKDWSLVYIDAGECAAECQRTLLGTANARQLLGKDLSRVNRVFLYSGACCQAELLKTQPDLVSASLDSDAGHKLLAAFPAIAGAALTAKRVYIVDPLGNLMMSYAPGADPRWIYQDLKKLLSLSHIG